MPVNARASFLPSIPVVLLFCIAFLSPPSPGVAQSVLEGGCLEDIAPHGVNCTANDVTFVLVGLGTQTDGCVQSGTGFCSGAPLENSCVTDLDCPGGQICEYLDEVDIFMRGIVQNTTAQARYDVGLWFAADGDQRLCSSNVCSDLTTTCTANSDCFGIGDGICDNHIRCAEDADCASFGGTCEAGDGARRGLCGRSMLGPAQVAYCSSDNPANPLLGTCETDAQCPGGDTCVVTGHCSVTTTTACFVDANCAGGESCVSPGCGPLDLDVNPPGDVTATGPYLSAEPGTSTGSGSPIDLCGDLFAGGISGCDENADGIWDDSVMDFTTAQTFPCADVDGDGFVNIPTCSTWGNNNSQVFLGTCDGGADIGNYCNADSQCGGGASCVDTFGAGPQNYANACDSNAEVINGTAAKCNCENVNSNIPSPNLDLTCSCGAASVSQGVGGEVACQISWTNDSTCIPPVFECSGNGARCLVNGDCPPSQTCDPVAEEFQCGTARYVQFETNDFFAGTTTDAGGAFAAGIAEVNASATYGADVVTTPVNPINANSPVTIDHVIGASVSGSVNFTYALTGPVSDGDMLELTTETLWVNFGVCDGGGLTQCSENQDCVDAADGTTCVADFSSPTTQSLRAVCPINVLATWVSVSEFEATRRGRDVVIDWRTDAEVGAVGFDLYRFDEVSGDNIQVNREPIAALQRTEGAAYRVIDRGAPFDDKLIYTVMETDLQGVRRPVGPFEVSPQETRAAVGGPSALDDFEGARALAPSKRQAQRAAAARAEAQAFRNERAPGGQAKPSGVAAGVGASALYRVTAVELATLLDTPVQKVRRLIDRGEIRISNGGVEVEWLADEKATELFFYGSEIDSQFTTENVYRMSPGKGTLAGTTSGGKPTPVGGGSFVDSVHYEEDAIPAVVVARDPDSDYWYWDGIVAQNPDTIRTFNLDVLDPTGAGAAQLSVLLYGATDDPLIPSEHQAIVRWNGVEIGSTVWDGVGDHAVSFPVNAAALNAGANTVEIEAVLGGGVSNSLFFIDSFDLEYSRSHHAVGDSLHFGGGGGVLSVDGFSSAEIRVLDISTLSAPVLVEGTTIDGFGGGFRVSFDSNGAVGPFYAVAEGAVGAPQSLTAEIESIDLRGIQGAEYVVIAPEYLTKAASELADYRRSRGLSPLVVSLEGVYTQFNDGIASPHAISAFVDYAYNNWSRTPRFLTLIGAASLDYRDLLGFGGNLVPTLMTSTPWGLFSSDLAFGDVVGHDLIPEVAVGRVPIFTADELSDYVAKVANYEANAGAEWRSRALMMADNGDDGGNFPLESLSVEAMLDPPLTPSRIDLSTQTVEEARTQMFADLAAGVGFANYVGHGSTIRLAHESLMSLADVPLLDNDGVEPIMASATCIIGRYAVPGQESLAEALVLEASGGAVAVWSPSGLSYNDDAVLLNRSMVGAAFDASGSTLGESVMEALQSYHQDGGQFDFMPGLFNVLGDPAIETQ